MSLLAVKSGQPLGELGRLEPAGLAALERATLRAEWGVVEELLACLLELVHTVWRTQLAAHSKKGARQPRPLRVPRPGEPAGRAALPRLSPAELASSGLAGRVVRASSSSSASSGESAGAGP